MNGALKILAVLLVAGGIIGGAVLLLLLPSESPDVMEPAPAAAAAVDPKAQPSTLDAEDEDLAAREEEPAAAVTEPANSAEPTLPNYPTASFLRGQVVDAAGRPVADAQVVLRAGGHGNRPFARIRRLIDAAQEEHTVPESTASTNSQGVFEMLGVPRQADLQLEVDHPVHVLHHVGGIHVPDRGLDLGLVTLTPGAAASGVVVGPGGEPVAGASVYFRPGGGGDQGNFMAYFTAGGSPLGERQTETDEKGEFRLTGLSADKGRIVALSEDFPESESDPVTLQAGEMLQGVRVLMQHGVDIVGVVRNAAGDPIEAASVTHRGHSNFFSGNIRVFREGGEEDEESVRTDAKGHFRLTGLTPGVYRVMADADGYARASVQSVEAGNPELVEVTLTANGGIAGRVLDGRSNGVQGYELSLQPHREAGRSRRSMPFPLRSGQPLAYDPQEPAGAFAANDLEAGNYQLIVRALGFAEARSEPFEVKAGERTTGISVTLEDGALLRGRVVDAHGNPVAEATIEAFQPEDNNDFGFGGRMRMRTEFAVIGGGPQELGKTRSQADGTFEITSLKAGTWHLDVRHEDFAMHVSEAYELAAAGAEENIEIQLDLGGTLQGLVVDASGQPRMGDTIQVRSPVEPRIKFSTTSDGDGRYSIKHIPVGDHYAYHEPKDEHQSPRQMFISLNQTENTPPGARDFTVKNGDVVELDFSQGDKPAIEGVVTAAQGPVAGAEVSATIYKEKDDNPLRFFHGPAASAKTGSDGSYLIEGLEPGHYEVSVRHPDGILPVDERVDATSTLLARQDFFLEGGGIAGVVRSSTDESPIYKAKVTLLPVREGEDEGSRPVQAFFLTTSMSNEDSDTEVVSIEHGNPVGSVRSREDGSFSISWIPAGRYKVEASHPNFIEGASGIVDIEHNKIEDDLVLSLEPGGVIEVTVLSSENRRPVPHRVVSIRGEDEKQDFTISDEKGKARFEGLRLGPYTVSLPTFGSDQAEEPMSRRVDVEPGRIHTVDMDL
jgi:hypothetical protein